MRIILASNRGTLMELGVTPIISAGMVLQLLAGSRTIQFNQSNKEDRVLFATALKASGIAFTFFTAAAYVFSGMYGPLSTLGMGNAILIIVQLSFAGIMLIMLDELLQKGYGMGSGINLFIAAHICENVLWSAFSPTTVTTAGGTEFEGAVWSFFHLLFTRKNKITALRLALYRSNLPNVTNLMATLLIFLLCIYFQGWKVVIPVKYQRYRGQEGKYPIKFFYTGNMPVVLLTALISNIYFASQIFYSNEPSNIFAKILGVWERGENGQTVPTSGLCYYLSPPTSMLSIIYDPFHFLFYLLFVCTACAVFSKAWTEISHTTARDVARQLTQQQISVRGMREQATANLLKRYIPIAAALGGMCIGLLTVVADLIGAIGSGTGILMAVTIIYDYYESYMKEQMAGMGIDLAKMGLQ